METAQLVALAGDLNGERPPLYAALATRVRLLVADGRIPVGSRLPPERDLAAGLHVSRATVAAAYRLLRDQGWVNARQGSGTWTRLPAGPAAGAWLPRPVAPGVIDLAHAAPSAPPQVPAAFAAALDDLPRLLHGHGYHPGGLPELRARIADRFTARGLPTTAEQVFVTGGALHGIAIAIEALVDRGAGVLVEHPTYPNALDAITSQGRRPVPVAIDAADPGRFVAEVTRAVRDGRVRAAYLMPDFQNPTGRLLDEPLRRRLAVGLEQKQVLTVVDETMVETGLDLDPPGPYAAFARPASVVTVGSMSKSVWGGLRIGWLRAEAEVIRVLMAVAARSQMSGPVLEQLAACHLLDRAEEVAATRRAELRLQRGALVTALAEHLPAWEVILPPGGLVLWCQLPGGSSTAIAVAAESRGLMLAAGPRFGTGHSFDDRLRLPYTQPVEVLRRGVELLADVVATAPGRRRQTTLRPGEAPALSVVV